MLKIGGMRVPQTKTKIFDRVIGIDLGNGLVKVRSITADGEIYELVLPSEYAFLEDVGNETLGNRKLNVETFKIDDDSYVWGEDITRISDTKKTYGYENRYKTEAYQTMVSIVLTKVVKEIGVDPKDKILLVTGVPSDEKDTVAEEEIKSAFLNGRGGKNGLYDTFVNDEEYIFKIARVVVTAQPLATILSKYLDVDGSVLDESYEHSKVGVIDIGAGTVDLDILDCLIRQPSHISLTHGFNDIYDKIKNLIHSVYPMHQVNNYNIFKSIQQAQKGHKGNIKANKYIYTPSRLKEPIDFTAAFSAGIREVSTYIQQAVASRWKDQIGFDEINLTGGSAKEFKNILSNSIEGLTIPEKAGQSNVEGYFRLGMEIMNYEQQPAA